MILLVGTTHDDILYFESKIRNSREEKIFKGITATIGTIYNQEVMLLHNVYTSYMSSTLITRIIDRYYVVLVFLLGKCVALSKDVKPGQIMVSKLIYFGDVNQYGKHESSLGQIPTLPRFFEGDDYVLKVLESCFNRLYIQADYRLATFISKNIIVKDKENIADISTNDIYYGIKDNVVFDSETGGAALACYLNDVPFLAIKVVEHSIGVESNIDSYIDVLAKYSDVGKALTACIGEITRNEVKDHD